MKSDERRQHKRLEVELEAAYRIIDKESQYSSSVLNISFNGIKLVLDREIAGGSKLELKVSLETTEVVRLIGEVRWCRKDEGQASYIAGLLIIKGKEDGRERFERYYTLRLLYPPVET